MLLCTPPTHASSQKVHDAWSAHHDMISGNGDSYSSNWNPQQRGPVSRTSHDDNTTDYSHLPIERVSSKNTLSSTGLNHNHNPFSPDHESWQSSNLSYRSLSDVSPQLISNIPFTPHRTGSPVVTSSWCPQDAIETATWSEAPGIAPFVTTIEPGYIDWTPIDQITTPWSATLSDSFQSPISIAPVSVAVPAPTPVPAPAPYRQQSFWAYKPQGIIESPAYAGMEMNAEIPYPTIYTTTSPQITSPLIHPAFQTNPAVVSDLSRVIMTAEFQTVDENSLPMSKQSISSTRTQPQLRLNTSSTNNNTHHHLPGAISKKKTTPKGGRVGPLTITQREKVEDMRTYGACWRCRKYKKPVSTFITLSLFLLSLLFLLLLLSSHVSQYRGILMPS